MKFDLEALGFTKEELAEKVIERCAEDILTSVGLDEEGEGHVRESSFKRSLTRKLDEIFTAKVTKATDEFLDGLIPKLLDHEFTETTSWGETKGTWTVRNRILKAIESQVVYKQTTYRSERNKFTELVDDVVSKQLEQFKTDFKMTVEAKFTAEALKAAEEALKKRLGVTS